MKLYHYYDYTTGPFKNLSDLSMEDAEKAMSKIRLQENLFAASRDKSYIQRRFQYEDLARKLFIEKGGIPTRLRPHYMTVEACDWLKTWYEDGRCICINANNLDLSAISFTYGDMFPTFGPRGNESTEYRKQVYTSFDIHEIIKKYGLPQLWNPIGEKGPIRYIECQIWSDDNVKRIIQLSK